MSISCCNDFSSHSEISLFTQINSSILPSKLAQAIANYVQHSHLNKRVGH